MTVPAPIFAPPTAATPPALPTATPLRSAAPTGTADPGRVGLQILSLSDDARVGATLIIGGVQARPTPPGLHVWAFVKADVPDARWYSWHRGEVVADRDTRWAIDLYLGGAPSTRHAVRIGTVDDAGHADLTTFLRDNPDQPLPSLPDGFTQEAQITVTLE